MASSLLHRILLLLVLLAGCNGLKAQRVSVSEGITLRKDDYYQVLGQVNGIVLMSTDNGYTLEISGFDEKLRTLWKKELELDKRRVQVIGVVPIPSGFTVVYQYSKKGEHFLKTHRYSETGQLRDSATLVRLSDGFNPPDCRMVVSDDRNKALVYFSGKQDRLTVHAISLQAPASLWQTEIVVDAFSFFRQFRSLLVDNSGRMHLMLEKDPRRSREEGYSMELIQFGAGYTGPSVRQITLDNLQGRRLRFAYDDKQGRIACAGLIGERGSDRVSGLFTFFLNPDAEGAFDWQTHPFSREALRKLTGSPEIPAKGIDDIELRELHLREDGGLIVLIEESRRVERSMAGQQFQFGAGGGRYIVDYYFDDILATSIGPDGTLDWQEVLAKKQYSQDDDGLYSSFFVMTAPDQLRLLYNDEIALENTVSAYTLDYRGVAERSSVLSTDYQKLKLLFQEAVQIGVYEVIVPSERSGKLKLVRIEF